MFGIHSFLLFIVSGLLLNITPGADMLYTVSRSTGQGIRAGVSAALGIATGIMIHITFAVAGLSALLATSAIAFAGVKYMGAVYLVYLGVKLLLKPDTESSNTISRTESSSLFYVYKQGVLINVLNPKIALFFLAFLPQFIDSHSNERALAFLALGLTFNVTGTCVNVLAAWSASSVRRRMENATVAGQWLRRIAGGIFIGLGVKLAWSARS